MFAIVSEDIISVWGYINGVDYAVNGAKGLVVGEGSSIERAKMILLSSYTDCSDSVEYSVEGCII